MLLLKVFKINRSIYGQSLLEFSLWSSRCYESKH